MNDIIYLYPKSSCPCDTCLSSYSAPKSGIKSNFSIRGYKPSPYFDCYNRVEIQKEIQPTDKSGIRQINPQVYTDKLAQGFDAVKCPSGCPVAPGCPQPIYLSRDPRQFDSMRADYIPLDTIPIDGDVRLKNIYSLSDDYGKGSMPYEKIGDGQIMYYIDKSIEDAFYKPVFSEQAEESAVLFQDPMGAMKPEYNRNALINTANPTITTTKKYPYCLSYIQDSQSFREDIMSLQQRKYNQEKWSARWANMNI